MRPALALVGAACLVAGWLAGPAAPLAAEPGPAGPIPPMATNVDLDGAAAGRAALARVPLSFEPARGEAGGAAQFLARGRGYGVFLSGPDAVLALTRAESRPRTAEPERARAVERTLLRMTLGGANPAPAAVGLEELPGKVNYFVGRDPKQWRTNVPTYAKVRYEAVYPGVDLVYYGNARQLEYDFVVAPGASPAVIALGFEGVGALAVDAQGDLRLPTAGGDLRLRRPLAYQEVDGARREVVAGYALRADGRVGFEVAAYDPTRPLVIDPVLVYSTYLGGLGEDNASGIAADATGIYVAGLTVSSDFPTSVSAYQDAIAGDYDAYVAKLNPSGSALIYSTYLGGSGTDYGLGLAVDASGNAYVTGLTLSTDFPTAGPPFQDTYGGGVALGDAFAAKLDSTGSVLLYSSYLGGSGEDLAIGIAADAAGNVYIAGRTSSTNLPLAGAPYQGASGGGDFDAFVAKVDTTAAGSASLVYATYLGGTGNDGANGIAVDGSGNAYVAGRTDSADFPTAGTPYQGSSGGGFDAFVAKLNPAGSSLLYSTYLGGSGEDRAFGIARDSADRVYVTGRTLSANFPTTPGAFDTTCGTDGACDGGFMDLFVAKLNPAATGAASLVYSTYLGGSRDEEGEGIAVDALGNAYVTGYTYSTDFPVANAFQPVCGVGCSIGFVDGFVTKLDATGSAVVFSTYLGGSSSDYGIAIAVDAAGNIYVSGETFSDNFPTVSPYNGSWAGSYDALVVKIGPAATSADLAVETAVAPDPGTVGSPLTYTLTVTNNGPDPATGVRLIDQLPYGLAVVSATPSQGACAFANGAFQEVRCDLGSLAGLASATATLVVTPFAPGSIATRASVASNVSDPAGANNEATRDTVVAAAPAPAVTSILPVSGSTAGGTPVTITGSNFQTGATVSLGGADATGVAVTAPDTITATTGAHAAGAVDVVVTNPDNQSAVLPGGFLYATPPTIANFTPASGVAGAHVTVNGTNLAGATALTFNGTPASITSNTSTRITADVPVEATTGPLGVTTPGGTATSAGTFTVKPSITGFTPASGAPGAPVTIEGAGLAGATSIKFDGTPATVPAVHPSTQIVTSVPANATTGKISVTTPAGTATSAASFAVAPRITAFTPASGAAGASVSITGVNFTGVTSVTFNGVSAVHVVNSTVKITATVPAGATTGPIAVTAPAGTGTSATSFTVSVTPAIAAVNPGAGAVGAVITITGTHFTGVTAVKFNGRSAPITSKSDTQITAKVPANATTGPITVTTPNGTATSPDPFTVAPRITSVSPLSGQVGASVTINGANFSGATLVTFNGTSASFTVATSARITATVPGGATKGKIAVTTPAGTATSGGTFTVKP